MKVFFPAWARFLVLHLGVFSLLLVSSQATSSLAFAGNTKSSTVKLWLQTMDSCRQAIPGARFALSGPNLTVNRGPGPGSGPQTVGQGSCPIDRGNCSAVSTGCLSWDLPVPGSGSVTYHIKELSSPSGYAICLGGSDCPHGSDVITLKVNSSGLVSATVLNTYPNGQQATFPRSGGSYTGTSSDPIVVHNSRIGNGNCDGDGDADDHTTGSEGSHALCDSDHDR